MYYIFAPVFMLNTCILPHNRIITQAQERGRERNERKAVSESSLSRGKRHRPKNGGGGEVPGPFRGLVPKGLNRILDVSEKPDGDACGAEHNEFHIQLLQYGEAIRFAAGCTFGLAARDEGLL